MSENSEADRVSRSLSISRAKGTWNDRVITDVETQVSSPLMYLIQTTLFYCERHSKLSSYSVSFHKDGKDGSVVANGIRKRGTDTITFPDRAQVVMEAKIWSSRATFRFQDREYHWKDTIRSSKLRNESEDVVAQFKKRIFPFRTDGELEIYAAEADLPVDVIIITFIMYLYHRVETVGGGGHDES